MLARERRPDDRATDPPPRGPQQPLLDPLCLLPTRRIQDRQIEARPGIRHCWAARCPKADCPAPHQNPRRCSPGCRARTPLGTSGPTAAAGARCHHCGLPRCPVSPATSRSPPPHAPTPASRHPRRRCPVHRTRPGERQPPQRQQCRIQPLFADCFSATSAMSVPTVACSDAPRAMRHATRDQVPMNAVNGEQRVQLGRPVTGNVIRTEEGSRNRIAMHQPVIEECQRQSLRIGLQP